MSITILRADSMRERDLSRLRVSGQRSDCSCFCTISWHKPRPPSKGALEHNVGALSLQWLDVTLNELAIPYSPFSFLWIGLGVLKVADHAGSRLPLQRPNTLDWLRHPTHLPNAVFLLYNRALDALFPSPRLPCALPWVKWLRPMARRLACQGIVFPRSRASWNARQRFSSSRWPQR